MEMEMQMEMETNEKKNLVLYHSNCWDGFGAAWAAWMKLGDEGTDYIPVNYGTPLPPGTQRYENIFILDFSYPEETILGLIQRTGIMRNAASKPEPEPEPEIIPRRIFILDHHATAKVDLQNLPRIPEDRELCYNPHPGSDPGSGSGLGPKPQDQHGNDITTENTPNDIISGINSFLPGIHTRFNMDKSGAKLAWEFFHTESNGYYPVSELIEYIEDRDLWRHKLRDSKEINAYIHTSPFDFRAYSALHDKLDSIGGRELAGDEGSIILDTEKREIEKICARPFIVQIGGMSAPCVNTSIHFSECADYLLKKFPGATFAAYYFDREDFRRQWGLRSREGEDINVGEIAKLYGGGGHRHAAGFTTPLLTSSRFVEPEGKQG